ncbi:MAG: AraC family transcriptional regulator [Prevotella conceptionensis]
MDTYVLHEITPLMETDALYIADRRKKEFSYPVHNHDVFELNFVENAAGVRRTVGDNSEVIGDFDLVLITSPTLEHVWEQHECKSEDIREITIQFNFGAGMTETDQFFGKTPFESIRRMMKEAQKGLAFPMTTIMKVYDKLDEMSRITDRFRALMQFLDILHTLSLSTGARTLATTSYAKVNIEDDSRRVLRVKKYISDNYMYELRLKTLADLANMSESAFCRFFKLHTGRRLSDYIIDIRMGHAARMLIDTTETIVEISFKCGYNNMSNFNRIFKRKKGCSPTEFRNNYHKIKVIV